MEVFQSEPYRFDLAITDQTMPEMTDATLARETAPHPLRYSDYPLNGFRHAIDANSAKAMGIDAFCVKPRVTRELAVTVQQVLDKCLRQEP